MKNYNSIGHLSGSKTGKGDRVLDAGHARYATEKAKSKYSRITAMEKVDGSNVGALRSGYRVVAITRSGRLAGKSGILQHRLFARWVEIRQTQLLELLADGERLVGEWALQAHGIRYEFDDNDPFFALDLINGQDAESFERFHERVTSAGFKTPCILADRTGKDAAVGVSEALALLGEYGHHGATEPAEGVVWRVEERGRRSFLCKFVRESFTPGKYIPNFNEACDKPTWNVPLELFS